jgi:hypothetical protein
MLVNQSDFLLILNDDAKAVETADVAFEGAAGNEKHFHFNPGLSHLIKKLVLNVKMRLRHFRTPVP